MHRPFVFAATSLCHPLFFSASPSEYYFVAMSWFSSLFTVPKLAPAPSEEKGILEEPAPSPPTNTTVVTATPSLQQSRPHQADPPNRNQVILAAGLAFFAFSTLITRRAFTRRRLASKAAFYSNTPGHNAQQTKQISPAMEAFEALNVATVNVLSITMMAAGGTLWYLDINNMHEARKFIRGGLGVDGTGRSEQDAEEEFEEWLATTLARKEAKEARAAMQDNGRGS